MYLEFDLSLHRYETDNKSFEFNLESNGRLKQPMKFEIKNTNGGYKLYKKSGYYLIGLGNITLFKENYKNKSYCDKNENRFDYHGIEKALCGKTKYIENSRLKGENFKPKRILVIQMK